jgi:hypothetical protein
LPTECLTGHERWRAPGFAPFRQGLAAFAPLVGAERLDALNAAAGEAGLVSGSGRALRFVAQSSPSVSGVVPSTSQALSASSATVLLPDDLSAYEARIFDTGEVPTRVSGQGERHDLYNAIVWLTFPRAKARLNALQADRQRSSPERQALNRPGRPSELDRSSDPNEGRLTQAAERASSQRGPLRDAATLFDENAVLWIGPDASFEAALRAFDWQDLFMRRRAQLSESVRLMVFGHALLEKLESPYKAVTAHAWPLRLPIDASLAEIDRALSLALDADTLNTRALCPLPVMGFPGWCAANADPHFYDDPAVFRSGRRGGKSPPDSVALRST